MMSVLSQWNKFLCKIGWHTWKVECLYYNGKDKIIDRLWCKGGHYDKLVLFTHGPEEFGIGYVD